MGRTNKMSATVRDYTHDVTRGLPCGCTIEGLGTLPDPLRPVLCPLHAAAPDLLAALQLAAHRLHQIAEDFAENTDERGFAVECWNDARAALAKAEGKGA